MEASFAAASKQYRHDRSSLHISHSAQTATRRDMRHREFKQQRVRATVSENQFAKRIAQSMR
ncbi:MAG: hypothetical protein NVSMB6_15080 [Burkholderiaceae bacterium]